MFNLETLDTLIAVVIVILVLSLIVQSIQTFIKKIFKLKSNQIEESLVDLFENALNAEGARKQRGFWLLRLGLYVWSLVSPRRNPAENSSDIVKALYREVAVKFQGIGRVAQLDRPTFNSLSKEDLLKVLRKVSPKALLDHFEDDIVLALQQVGELQYALDKMKESIKTINLGGDASAKFAALSETLNPLLNDLKNLVEEGAPKSNLMTENIADLREIKLGEVFGLLGEVQERVKQAIDSATDDASKAAFNAMAGELNRVAAALTDLTQRFDAIIAPLRVRLKEIESWYDTVMHSFEERYSRSMKTWAFVISLLVAVWLNANIFNIYRDVSTNAERRKAILQSREEVLRRYEESLAAAKLANGPLGEQTRIQGLIESARQDIEKDAAKYASFGFPSLDEEIQALPHPPQSKALHVLLWSLPGWLLMAALLSLGAPFWHDTLESLFGLKNLLRKRGDIRNVETEPGAGQPRQ